MSRYTACYASILLYGSRRALQNLLTIKSFFSVHFFPYQEEATHEKNKGLLA